MYQSQNHTQSLPRKSSSILNLLAIVGVSLSLPTSNAHDFNTPRETMPPEPPPQYDSKEEKQLDCVLTNNEAFKAYLTHTTPAQGVQYKKQTDRVLDQLNILRDELEEIDSANKNKVIEVLADLILDPKLKSDAICNPAYKPESFEEIKEVLDDLKVRLVDLLNRGDLDLIEYSRIVLWYKSCEQLALHVSSDRNIQEKLDANQNFEWHPMTVEASIEFVQEAPLDFSLCDRIHRAYKVEEKTTPTEHPEQPGNQAQ